MMKRYFLIFLFFTPIAIFAQDQAEDSLHQQIIMSVLQQVNQYDDASSFANERLISQFITLFESHNTMVVNDIPAMGEYDDQIQMEDYVRYMRKYYTRIAVNIDIHEISEINFENENKGSLSVFLTKKVYGPNAQHVADGIEADENYINYEDQFELELRFTFNNGSVKISNISLIKPKGKLLVVVPYSKTNFNRKVTPIEELKIKIKRNGNEKEIYISDYFYSIPDINESTKISISSKNENFIGERNINLDTYNKTGAENLYPLKFIRSIGELQAFTLIPFSSQVTGNANTFGAKVSDNSTPSYGFTIGFDITPLLSYFIKERSKSNSKSPKDKSKKNRFSILPYLKGGLLVESFDYDINISEYTESYIDFDIDGGNYLRTVFLTDFSENQKIDMQTTFGQLEFRIKYALNEKVSVLFSPSIGIGFAKVHAATYTNSALGNYSGYYKDLFGVTIANNGVYNFGEFNLIQSGDLTFNNVQTLLLGLDVSMKYRSYLAFSVGIFYTKFQNNIFDIGQERVSHESNIFNPSETNELNTINNLIDVNMNPLLLKVGISCKF